MFPLGTDYSQGFWCFPQKVPSPQPWTTNLRVVSRCHTGWNLNLPPPHKTADYCAASDSQVTNTQLL